MATRKTTTTRKTTSRAKSTTARKPSAAKAKPAAAAKPEGAAANLMDPATAPTAAKMTVVNSAEPVVAATQLKKKDFIDRVVAASGLKKKDVKPVVETTLAELGAMISEGSEMQTPELGKLMIQRRKEVSGGEVVVLKLRRKTAEKPLANDGEEG